MRMLLRIGLIMAAGYAAVCIGLYLLQDQLTFFPRPLPDDPVPPRARSSAAATVVETDGVALRGWVVNPAAEGPLIVYFGGNAEELSTLTGIFTRLNATTALINYRGFGASEGSPSAAQLVADAAVVTQAMHQRWGHDRPLILFGRSIGSGIAAQASRGVEADALVLMSPYRSLTHVAERWFPYLPVRTLMRHRIDTTAALDALPRRILVLHASNDRVVPTAESRALVRLLDPAPRVVEFDASHNVPLTDPQIWPHLEDFVDSVGNT